MKSKNPPNGQGGSSYGDPEKDLTSKQLAKIGSLAIGFNYAETALDRILMYTLNLGSIWVDVVKRIGSIDKKINLSKISVAHFDGIITRAYQLPQLSFIDDYRNSIGAFGDCKKYRDSVLHSQIYNSSPTIGKLFGYEGEESASHVLMTIDALERMYRELVLVRQELETVERLCSLIRPSVIAYDVSGQPKLPPEPEAQECVLKFRILEKSRKSLGPRPKFPDQL